MENVEIAKALRPRVETATRPCDAAAENRRRTGERVSRPADDHGQIPALTGVRALAAWLVFFHHHRTSLLEVGPLVPRKGNTNKALRPLSFRLEVDRIGGKWLVNYFMPLFAIGHPMVDKQGSGGN